MERMYRGKIIGTLMSDVVSTVSVTEINSVVVIY